MGFTVGSVHVNRHFKKEPEKHIILVTVPFNVTIVIYVLTFVIFVTIVVTFLAFVTFCCRNCKHVHSCIWIIQYILQNGPCSL